MAKEKLRWDQEEKDSTTKKTYIYIYTYIFLQIGDCQITDAVASAADRNSSNAYDATMREKATGQCTLVDGYRSCLNITIQLVKVVPFRQRCRGRVHDFQVTRPCRPP